jgi:hypothetical protein
VQEIGCSDGRIHTDLMETAAHLRLHDCGTIIIGDTTDTPQEGERRLIGHGLAIGHAAPLEIRVGFAVQTAAEFSHEP